MVYRFHARYFELPVQKFNEIHYAGMAALKILILVFNLAPYLALRLAIQTRRWGITNSIENEVTEKIV
jgi:hypothetical protein|tara:strand:- start:123 stop:326 length:204 start_codon:yes stop_codon:yes gene_type:complete